MTLPESNHAQFGEGLCSGRACFHEQPRQVNVNLRNQASALKPPVADDECYGDFSPAISGSDLKCIYLRGL